MKTQLQLASPNTTYSLLKIKTNRGTNQENNPSTPTKSSKEKTNRTHFIKHLAGMIIQTFIPTVLIPYQNLSSRPKRSIFRECPNSQRRTPRTCKEQQTQFTKKTQMGIDPLTKSIKKSTSIKPKNKGFRRRVDLGFSKIIKQSLLVTITNINIARIVTKSDKGLTR